MKYLKTFEEKQENCKNCGAALINGRCEYCGGKGYQKHTNKIVISGKDNQQASEIIKNIKQKIDKKGYSIIKYCQYRGFTSESFREVIKNYKDFGGFLYDADCYFFDKDNRSIFDKNYKNFHIYKLDNPNGHLDGYYFLLVGGKFLDVSQNILSEFFHYIKNKVKEQKSL